jgi:myo-inositol-1-phosphate synthase
MLNKTLLTSFKTFKKLFMSLIVQGTSLAPEFESNDTIESTYDHTYVEIDPNGQNVTYRKINRRKYTFKTQRHPRKVGLMLVGMGGNNGMTLIGGLLANKHKITWKTKKGEHQSNIYGSMT